MIFYNYLHANQGEPPEPVICEFCDKFFVNEEDLKIHMIIHDAERIDEEEKEVICDKCCKIFDSMKDLDIHIKEVHENERITKIQTPQKQQELSVKRQALLCEKCYECFESKETLDLHDRVFHQRDKMNSISPEKVSVIDLIFNCKYLHWYAIEILRQVFRKSLQLFLSSS